MYRVRWSCTWATASIRRLIASAYAQFTGIRFREIQVDHNVPVALLGVPPYVEYDGEQDDHEQRNKLRQFVGEPRDTVALHGGIGGNENKVAGNRRVKERQDGHNPRANHATGHLIGARHIGILVAQDQVRREDEQVREGRRRDGKAKHQAEQRGRASTAGRRDDNRRRHRDRRCDA